MSTFYLDFELGNDSNDGTTWANAWKTFTNGATAARTAPGDTIRIAKTEDAASLEIDTTWVQNKKSIMLGPKIGACNAAWSCSTNVSSSYQTYGGFDDGVDNGYCSYINPSAAFTTGLMAWKDLPATVDLTGYTKFSVWIKTSIALTAGDFSILLDNTSGCTSPLETLVSSYASADTVDTYEYTWDLSDPSALSAVTSIGIAMNVDRGTMIFYISAAYAWNPIDGTLPICIPEEVEFAKWTGKTDITLSLTTPVSVSDRFLRIAPASGFTTGLACYKNYGSGQDWSDYTYVSALVRVYGTALDTGTLQLLIDDTVACASPLETITNTCPLEAYQYVWVKFRLSNPSALTSVRSVGFGFAVDPGTSSVDIGALFLSDGFTGNCLISDDIDGNDWYAISSYRCSSYMYMGSVNLTGYELNAIASKTVATYYRQTFPGSSEANTCKNIIQESGTAGNLITYSGGWNRTNTTQDGETWLDAGIKYTANGIIGCAAERSYIKIEKIALIRGSAQFYAPSYGLHNSDINFTQLAWGAAQSKFGYNNHDTTITIGGLSLGGIKLDGSDAYRCTVDITKCIEGASSGGMVGISGQDHTVSVGSVYGWRSYAALILGCYYSRITCGAMHGGAAGYTALSLSGASYNHIKFTGDIIGRTTGSTVTYGFYISQAGGNVITFTKSGAKLSHFAPNIYYDGSYGAGTNSISGVEMSDVTGSYDIIVTGKGGDLLLSWCKLSSTNKIYSNAGTYGTVLRFHHYNQTLNDHRNYVFGMADGTSPASFVRNTVNADADDCIDVALASGLTGGGMAVIMVGWVLLEGGVSKTVSVKMKKDSSFNGRVPMLGLKGEGMLVDMTRSATALTTSYQTYSMAAVNPARDQYAQVYVMVDGTAGHLYIDTISVA